MFSGYYTIIHSLFQTTFDKLRRVSSKKYWEKASTKRAHLSGAATFYWNRWICSFQKLKTRFFFSSAIYFVNMNKEISIIKYIMFTLKNMFAGSLQETNIIIYWRKPKTVGHFFSKKKILLYGYQKLHIWKKFNKRLLKTFKKNDILLFILKCSRDRNINFLTFLTNRGYCFSKYETSDNLNLIKHELRLKSCYLKMKSTS